MTAKISVSVPDDVAEYLARQPNASAAVAEAVRRQMKTSDIEDILAARGIHLTEEGRAHWRRRLSTPMPPEVLAEGRRMSAAARAGRLDEYLAGR